MSTRTTHSAVPLYPKRFQVIRWREPRTVEKEDNGWLRKGVLTVVIGLSKQVVNGGQCLFCSQLFAVFECVITAVRRRVCEREREIEPVHPPRWNLFHPRRCCWPITVMILDRPTKTEWEKLRSFEISHGGVIYLAVAICCCSVQCCS